MRIFRRFCVLLQQEQHFNYIRTMDTSTRMPPFLQLVAHDLYGKIGRNLSSTAIVFPNKRAGLFFDEYLSAESAQPIWSPAYLSISDLFLQLSDLKPGDPVRLVCLLYRIFCQETGSQETLDDFYNWGELLISDFDDVDKNLVDASRLLGNLQDLHNLDGNEFLNKEQEEAIRHFFRNFSLGKHTLLKQRFLSLWNKLGSIYQRYRGTLLDAGIAYEGMLYRRAIERLDLDALKYDRYVFVGFNVLNKVETEFFTRLHEAGKAMFYWDYDIFYTRLPNERRMPYRHEAGEFIAGNLKKFPNQLPEACFDVMRRPKDVCFISAPTENAQARFLKEALAQTTGGDEPAGDASKIDTAVVLCNESMLLPVIHSIPPEVRHINVTMGFPLAQTPAFSFMNTLLELQIKGFRPDTGRYTFEAAANALKHPYIRLLSPTAAELGERLLDGNRFYLAPSELGTDRLLGQVFTPQQEPAALCSYLANLLREVSALYRGEEDPENDTDLFNQLYRESLFKCYTCVNRLLNLIESGELTIQASTLGSLLLKLLSSTAIPFHGEPIIGLQIMGVLETRNLDFRNLFILSLNEGQLPKTGNDSSFIPYNLRKAFGMTTIDHQNAVYAYYFYRLMQRAERVTLLYNTSSDGLNRGEMSRFMRQFQLEWPHEISFRYLDAGQTPQRARNFKIDKSPLLYQALCECFDTRHKSRKFSPSALNAYLDCPMRFFYYYVAGIEAPEEASAEIDSALFGTIFHRTAELAYACLTAHGKTIQSADIDLLIHDGDKIGQLVNQAFNEELFHACNGERPEYNGTQLIHAEAISAYIRQLLRIDRRHAPFTLEACEYPVSKTMTVKTPQQTLHINIGGTIDRIDKKDGILRIIDYKTGGTPKTAESIAQLFAPGENRAKHIFQTFLYAYIVSGQQKAPVAPALLYIHKAASENYSPHILIGAARAKALVTDFAPYAEEFGLRLQTLLEEIFNPGIPFVQTECAGICEYCDYRRLCKR